MPCYAILHGKNQEGGLRQGLRPRLALLGFDWNRPCPAEQARLSQPLFGMQAHLNTHHPEERRLVVVAEVVESLLAARKALEPASVARSASEEPRRPSCKTPGGCCF